MTDSFPGLDQESRIYSEPRCMQLGYETKLIKVVTRPEIYSIMRTANDIYTPASIWQELERKRKLIANRINS